MKVMMTPDRWSKIKEILGTALEYEADEQQAFLDEACAEDQELRSEIDSLIAAYDRDDRLSVPEWPAALGGVGAPSRSIGPYRLVRELGVGGMGQVWLAEQTEPVRRQVAIKLIRAALYDPQVAQRFFSERQSLALMNHPAIAKIFDAGTAPSGQPYLVMEYVDGCPITEYCDRHKLALAERLKLFQQVCEGVQHAHQKAVLHRDLKPSNILVTAVDGKPMPQIIDFGVARDISRSLDLKAMFTQVGAVIGTIGYISPEQSGLSGEDIDTRSDVYSLGVVLYELLVGALPFDLKNIGSRESLHRMHESDPPRPSTRLRTLGEDTELTAQSRSTAILPLIRQLRGDLDAITLKALENDRGRRYATPSALAADIGNYLGSLPVSARVPSYSYRAKKYIRRYRLGVSVAAAGLLLLLSFAVAQTIQLRNVRQQRDRADRITDFMTNMFKVSDPSESRGDTVTAREILDKSAGEIAAGVGLDSSVQSQLMGVMAETYLGLGLYSRARDLAERALQSRRQLLGSDDPKTLEFMSLLGVILSREGRETEADTLLRQTIALQTRVLGPDNLSTLETKGALALSLVRQGHNAEAATLAREATAGESRLLGSDNIKTLRSMNTLATALKGDGHFDEAERIFHQLLETERRSLGADHPYILGTMHNFANMLEEQGRYEEAEIMQKEALAIERRILGAEHPDTVSTLTMLANTVLRDSSRKAEAEALYREAVATALRVVGPEHPVTTRAEEGLASVLSSEHHNNEAETIFRKILDTRQKVLGPDNMDVLFAQYNLADVLAKEKRFAEAEKLLTKTLEQQKRMLDTDDPDIMASKTLLASILLEKERPQEALELAQQSFDAQLRVLGPQHQDTQETLLRLAESMSRLGRYAQAQALYLSTIDHIERLPKADVRLAWYNFACMAAVSGHSNDALDYLERAVQHGFADPEGLKTNEDLRALRNEPRFSQIVVGAQKRADAAKQRL
ncbi:MAG TPA: serine/threonine-protein kinase [Steroidobacteraceae bacterium]|nr:serine/threonine-protein kinase [Steroidobacteraceae bacterium]